MADLELDLMARRARRAGPPLDLLPREYTLLEMLMRNMSRVATRTMLLERVRDFHFDPKTSVVETHISRLRAKIGKPFEVPLPGWRPHHLRGAGASQSGATPVCDNGPGIPADGHDRVLRRLYRMEQSRISAGSGLGLARLKAVADLHGASLTLTETAPGLTVEIARPQVRGPA